MDMLPAPFLANPRLVLEIAQGLEHPDIVASRYDLSPVEWERLRVDPAFVSQVDAKRAELQREGHSFRAKCALAAEDLLAEVYIAAKRPEAGFGAKLDAAKWFAKMGNLEPKEDRQAAGANFSFVIDMGTGQVSLSMGGVPRAKTVDAVEAEVVEVPGASVAQAFPFIPGELAAGAA